MVNRFKSVISSEVKGNKYEPSVKYVSSYLANVTCSTLSTETETPSVFYKGYVSQVFWGTFEWSVVLCSRYDDYTVRTSKTHNFTDFYINVYVTYKQVKI